MGAGRLEAMRSPLLSPVWLVGHVLVAAVLVSFPLLGLWQLDRHEQQQATHAALDQRPDQPPLQPDELDGDPDELVYRRADLAGTWEPTREILLSTRAHQGRPGHRVLTPLRLSNGSAVLVDRGWVPYDVDAPPVEDARPPDGRVEVTGLVLPRTPARRAGTLDGEGQAASDIGAGDAIEFISHADPAVVGRALGEPLPAVVVRADGGHRSAGAELPVTVPPPEPEGEVDHFSYAMQWFLFAVVVAVGYPVLLWRRQRDGGQPPADYGLSAADTGPSGAEGEPPATPGPDGGVEPNRSQAPADAGHSPRR